MCYVDVTNDEVDQSNLLYVRNLCQKRSDGVNNPNSLFCGKGCGCMGKRELRLCITCKEVYDEDNTIIVIKRKKGKK